MGGGTVELKGPDLKRGVRLADIPDGGVLLGHADGAAVLLARRGDEVSAIGATCTHYGGPLAEGLVVGDTVRCPWHHACFSVKTGEPLGAPALNPVDCYGVKREGELVMIGTKRAQRYKTAASGAPSSVLIVGAGAAGGVCAEALRREGFYGSITLVGDEPQGPVDRPNLSKDYLAGNAPEEWIPLRPGEFYEKRKIDLRLGTPVASLDAATRTVTLSDGARLSAEVVVLATGAEPIVLPGAEGVLYLRTLADSRAIIARASGGAKRAVVIGASFIGLEVAASLRARGLEVDVVAPEALPLARVLGDELGAFVKALHEEHGVRFHLGTKPKTIAKDKVTLENGETLACDLVVAGIGVRPRTQLAEKAGLATHHGILVDERLQTSARGIYAIGDVARYPDPVSGAKVRIEHWVVAERHAQAVARTIVGRGGPFRDVPFFWSQHYDVPINYVGHAETWDTVRVKGSISSKDFIVGYEKQGKLLAVASIYRDGDSLAAEAAFERGDTAALAKLFA
jgi:NADPH-dependent 2,4-dienoyl-CoA reductase/sulfur reductase-like enzyme/nitrite reductase/ring-hydroxylating ferredoxin subunit